MTQRGEGSSIQRLEGGRFEIYGRLGAGSYGDVYRAIDHERGFDVALKILRGGSASAVSRFKSEFRSLADIDHPNLVSLYELFGDAENWFFSMELALGENLIACLRGSRTAAPTLAETSTREDAPETIRGDRDPESDADVAELGRLDPKKQRQLCDVLGQLEAGLSALHRHGKLHRDVKPSNVLVTHAENRVVLLDFGLVTHLGVESDRLGTPEYMSPEQSRTRGLSPASDWYSVGVVLYQALSGRLPFYGSPAQISADKLRGPAPKLNLPNPSPIETVLVELANRLLSTEPADRPTGPEVAATLGSLDTGRSGRTARERSFSHVQAPLVGRDAELAQLIDDFDAAVVGRQPAAVLLSGDSGIGKTMLCHALATTLTGTRDVIVLHSRCYETESIAYKAFDELLETFSELIGERCDEVILHADWALLGRVFPSISNLTESDESVVAIPADPVERRRRAFVSFADVVAALSLDRPLVLILDDLQWSDVESVRLLVELLRKTRDAQLFVVGVARKADRESEALAELAKLRDEEPYLSIRTRELGPLDVTQARRLSSYLTGSRSEQSDAIAVESGGSPFFIRELAREAQVGGQPPSLNRVVGRRIAELELKPKAVLSVAAVAGKPVDVSVVEGVLHDTPRHEVGKAVWALRASNLLRFSGGSHLQAIAPFHDRIRAAALAQLSSKVRVEISAGLARELERRGGEDPATLGRLWNDAGDQRRALRHFCLAGSQALESFAFERAASLFSEASRLEAGANAGNFEQLALALANSGRGVEAARSYLEAARLADDENDAIEFRRSAAEQLLRSGRIVEGSSLIRDVFAELGIKVPEHPLRALGALLLHRAVLAVRGYGFRERTEEEIDRKKLLAIDACASIGIGMAMVDPVRGADFQARALLRALRAGEPTRIARTMALEVAFSGVSGGRANRRTEALIARTVALAEAIGDRLSRAVVTGAEGFAHHQSGRFVKSAEKCSEALALIEPCHGTSWERASCLSFLLESRYFLGEIRKFRQLHEEALRDAVARGDNHAAVLLRIGWQNLAWLSAGDSKKARSMIAEAMTQWPNGGFHVQHFLALVANIHVDFYEGKATRAHARFKSHRPRMRFSLLRASQNVRVEISILRAATAQAHAKCAGGDAGRVRRIANRCIRALRREDMRWVDPFVDVIRGAQAELDGNPRRASVLCARAAAGFEKADLAVHALSLHRASRMLREDDVDEIDQRLIARGIADPPRYCRIFAPSIFLGRNLERIRRRSV